MPRKHSARPPSKQGDKELPSGSQSPIGWLSRAALARAALPALTSQFLTREASEFAALKPVPERGGGGVHLRWAPSLPCAEAPRPAALAPEGPGSPGREEGGMWGGPGRTLLPGGLCPCCLIRTQIWCPCSSDPPYPHPGHGLERGDSPAAFQKPLELSCVDRWLPARAQQPNKATRCGHALKAPPCGEMWGRGVGWQTLRGHGERGSRRRRQEALLAPLLSEAHTAQPRRGPGWSRSG